MSRRDDEVADEIEEKIKKINKLAVEAARRGEVAEEKRKGLEIESVESIRLFREASGYLLRTVDLRKHFEVELTADIQHVRRVLGHIDDYNQLLEELRNNDTFRTTVEPFEQVSYSTGKGASVTIGNQSVRIMNKSRSSGLGGMTDEKDYPAIRNFVAPRMIRKTEQLENGLIGRCMSGK